MCYNLSIYIINHNTQSHTQSKVEIENEFFTRSEKLSKLNKFIKI